MAEFGVSPEDKFKLSLLSIEKRFVELEGAVGELQHQIQNIKPPENTELEQRISDLEDLIYVEQAGIEELKGMLESQQETKFSQQDIEKIVLPAVHKAKAELENKILQIQNVQTTNPQQMNQINSLNNKLNQVEGQLKGLYQMRTEVMNELNAKMQQMRPDTHQLSQVNQKINQIESQLAAISEIHTELDDLQNRIQQMENLQLSNPQQKEELNEINKKLNNFEGQLKVLYHFRAELDNLKNKLEPLNPETVKAIVSEVSDLRIEAGREIRELKEKVGNVPLYADIQFLSNRVKDLKITVDNLLNMKVEVDAKILNLERGLAERGGSSSAVSMNLMSEIEDTKKQLFAMQKKLSGVDAMTKELMERSERTLATSVRPNEAEAEVQRLYAKMNELYGNVERKAMEMNRLTPVNIDDKISELNEKISAFEDEIRNIRSRQGGFSSRFYDDEIKELLEKIILLETRVNVLETSTPSAPAQRKTESIKTEPIILE